jgi:hypothetical protein
MNTPALADSKKHRNFASATPPLLSVALLRSWEFTGKHTALIIPPLSSVAKGCSRVFTGESGVLFLFTSSKVLKGMCLQIRNIYTTFVPESREL